MFKFVEGLEVVGREYFPLNNGEVNFNLIEPTGMDWGMYKEQVGPLRAEAALRKNLVPVRSLTGPRDKPSA